MQQNSNFTMRTAFLDIYNKGGLAAVYEGVLPMSAEAIAKVAMRFYVFTYCRDVWKNNVQSDPTKPVGITGTIVSGAAAGAIESMLVVIPCELLKVRHMTQAGHEPFTTVFRNVIREEGVAALYKGGTSTLLRQVLY
jgi:hypothetical protein